MCLLKSNEIIANWKINISNPHYRYTVDKNSPVEELDTLPKISNIDF